MARETLTSDLGLAIRDYLEGNAISHVDDGTEKGDADAVSFVDVSDPNNPVFQMENGAVFKVMVVRVA